MIPDSFQKGKLPYLKSVFKWGIGAENVKIVTVIPPSKVLFEYLRICVRVPRYVGGHPRKSVLDLFAFFLRLDPRFQLRLTLPLFHLFRLTFSSATHLKNLLTR